jgi:hypothetical protein
VFKESSECRLACQTRKEKDGKEVIRGSKRREGEPKQPSKTRENKDYRMLPGLFIVIGVTVTMTTTSTLMYRRALQMAPINIASALYLIGDVNMSQQLSFVAIRDHSLNPMHIRAKAPQLHLLALGGLNSQRICVHPLICWDIG